MRANREMRAQVCAFAVSTDEARASRSVHTSPQVPSLEARLLRAIRDVHRRLPSGSGAKSLPDWAVVLVTTPDTILVVFVTNNPIGARVQRPKAWQSAMFSIVSFNTQQ